MEMLPSDKPTPIDHLGFEPYVKGVENLIRQTDPDDLPLAIGIYGAWGSGKTSFMLQLKSLLEANTDGLSFPTIWFDAWRYDRMQDVRSALIYNILFALQTKATAGAKEKLESAAKNLGRLTLGIIKQSHVHLGVPGGGGVTLPSVEEAQEYTDYWKTYQPIVDRFASEFGQAVGAYLGQCQQKQEAKLVIFIDDLDRCLPENVMVVLEALKLFLVESQCVFVIGVDRTVVERAIQAHYNTDPGGLGREYLDKIIRYPFNIPPPEPTKLKEYFGQLTQPDSRNDQCLHVLKVAAEGNPRVYLRLINAWNLVASLAPHVIPSLWQGDRRHILAIATAVRIRFPALHEACCRNPRGLHFLFDNWKNPPREEINHVLTRGNAVEYAQFWENATAKHFFLGLDALGTSSGTLLGPETALESAFNLSASVT